MEQELAPKVEALLHEEVERWAVRARDAERKLSNARHREAQLRMHLNCMIKSFREVLEMFQPDRPGSHFRRTFCVPAEDLIRYWSCVEAPVVPSEPPDSL